MLRRSTILAALFATSAIATACAVGGDDSLSNNPGRQIPDPPQGGSGGSFNPGNGGVPGSGASYGSGASSSVGTGGGGESGTAGAGGSDPPKPPECSDELKRCEREFTYPDSGETSVELRGDFAAGAWEKGVALSKSGTVWKTTVQVPYNKPVTYKFFINGKDWVNDPDPSAKLIDDGLGGKNSVTEAMTCDWWSCDEPPPTGTFDWRDAVLYFVFVDRFLDGDASNNAPISGVDPAINYQGGDWKGLQQKIDEGYFTDLGVNALWLTVPLDNTEDKGIGDDGRQYSAYHGYWPRNMDKVEEHFGTLDDLKKLVDSAHKQGIKIILDYAMNHVHVASPVYQQHKDWFWPNENNGNNCVCGQGCSWDGAEGERCWFRDYLPDFNFGIKEARDFSVSNALQWINDTGIDGFRLDAIKHINIEWVKDLRSRVKSEVESKTGEHFYMVGETFTGDKPTIKKYVDPSTLLDGQFDFPLRMEMADKMLMRRGSMKELDAFLGANDSFYGSGALMSTFIGNHDIPRPIHLAQDVPLWDNQWADGKDKAWDNKPSVPSGNSAFERLAGSFTLLLTTRGVPLIYYGDEVGMAGAGDPDNRRMMQWNGYTPGQTFLNNHIKKLTKIRSEHPALRRGTRATVSVTDDVIAYKMSTNGDTVYVAINRADGERPAANLPANATDLLTGATVSGPSVNIPARGSMILVEKLDRPSETRDAPLPPAPSPSSWARGSQQQKQQKRLVFARVPLFLLPLRHEDGEGAGGRGSPHHHPLQIVRMKTIRHWAPNGAGFRLALYQTFDEAKLVPGRRPVLIVPGYGMNSFIFSYHPGGVSMEGYLAERGFEVWRADLREQGETQWDGGSSNFSLEDLALTDVGVVLDKVLAETRTKADRADIVGCSLGGALMFTHAALNPKNRMGTLVSMGSPVRWERVHPLIKLAFSSPALAGMVRVKGTRKIAEIALPVLAKRTPWLLSVYMNPEITDVSAARELVRTVEDPNRHINRQMAEWINRRDLIVRGVNVSEAIGALTNPFLCVVANGDGIVPRETAAFPYHKLGSTKKKLLEVGTETIAMAHADLFISREAHERVFAPLSAWLTECAD